MDAVELQKKRLNRIILVSAGVVAMLVIACMVMLTKNSIGENVENRVLEELESASGMQTSAFMNSLEEKYDPLYCIEDMMAKGVSFTSDEMRHLLDSLVKTDELCTLEFADTDGNAVTYTGEQVGNVSEREYFKNIMGGADKSCIRLETTLLSDNPRVIFSIPVHDKNEKLTGVLSTSMEISSLEDSLFEMRELFGARFITFVCDSEGNVIVANNSAYSRFQVYEYDADENNVFDLIPDLEKIMDDDSIKVSKIRMRGSDAFASLVPLDVNDWQLVCIVDENTAVSTYAEGLSLIEELVTKATVIFFISLAFIFTMAFGAIREINNHTRAVRRSYENYKVLLQQMNCTVIEYDPNADVVFSLKTKDNPYGLENFETMDDYVEFKRDHPEFDSEEFERDFDIVRETNKTCTCETILRVESGEIHWIKVMLIPIMNEAGYFRTFIAVMDVSDVHSEFENTIDSLYNIPGGIYRCYINGPVHLQYYSQRFCEMLGYTYEEVSEVITGQHKYEMLVYPDDRDIYNRFINRLVESGGIDTCEYRMICKDGTLLAVKETMDVRRNASGNMYGYSVVTDLNKYREIQEELELELEDTKQQLQQARVKNSNSQMQPHFLYNALASIREVVLDDPDYASDLIYDFTTHLRACIKSMSNDNLIPFSQEIENVKAYVNIEKMRFGDRIDVRYDCRETEFDIIPLSIQPLVENAIRHGLFDRMCGGGLVTVRSYKEGGYIKVEVEDNGVGFDFKETMERLKSGETDSTGLYNLIFRFRSLQKACVRVESRIGEGTKVTISIPTGEKS